MLQLVTRTKYEKEVEKARKRGHDLSKLNDIIKILLVGKPLPPKNRNHKLGGNYNGCWECHIEPDWLFIYQKTSTQLICIRTGSHSDLF